MLLPVAVTVVAAKKDGIEPSCFFPLVLASDVAAELSASASAARAAPGTSSAAVKTVATTGRARSIAAAGAGAPTHLR